jgi:hypothetical protein
MLDSGLLERSERLAARVDALASALHAGAVAEDAAARLLAHASTAVLQALTLEALLERPEPTVAAPVEEPARESSIPLAA